AYNLYTDSRGVREIATQAALIDAWETARALGLFDKKGRFSREIMRGADVGKDAIFEYIVPAQQLPGFSADPANIRIVAPSRRRQGDQLTEREEAYRRRLAAVGKSVAVEANRSREKAKSSREEETARWKKDVKEAGEAFNQAPVLRLEGKISGTPSNFTNGRYRVSVDVLNFSRHPTEVNLEVTFIGISGIERKYFEMGKEEETLRLRKFEEQVIEVYSGKAASFRDKVAALDGLDPKNKRDKRRIKLAFKGWVARALHQGEVVGFVASIPDLLRFVDPEAEEPGQLD
ncbi:MAG: hypothetical protein ACC661_05645, partial [Verrucomicrobiales bacterium]